jgi:O-antigen ligase
MTQSLKNLLVVLFFATVIFRLAKPIMLAYTPEQDFRRRRTVWYVLTIAAFLAPSPWLYGAVAVPLLFAAGRKDSNPAALYLFVLHVTPNLVVGVPVLDALSTQFMLTIGIMVPAAYRLFVSRTDTEVRKLRRIDGLFLAYIALSCALYIHLLAPNGGFYPTTSIDFVRRLFYSVVEIFVPYFVLSRTNRSRRAIDDSVASLWLPCAVMAALAIFETVRSWPLYGVIPQDWGIHIAPFLIRGDSLRAMASAGHPLALGYLLAIAFGCWLYLQQRVRSQLARLGFGGLLWLGEFASFSRGPWMCMVLIYFLFVVQMPRAVSAVTRWLVVGALAATAVAFSPLGDKVASLVPFLGGHVDTDSIAYRQRLWDRGWEEIWRNPWFGNQYVMSRLEDLRQGEGIIDFVNGYIAQLLATGFVGLALFLSVVLIAVYSAWVARARIRRVDVEFSMLGATLVACLLGTLFLWALGGPDLYVLWALLGLAGAYAGIRQQNDGGAAVSQA